ncbi:MAG: capsule biosynthesis protein CapA [Alphaproteobacteria bacterium]
MHIVLLQGPASPFFAQLAQGFAARGHRITKINFCGGCDAMWRGERPLRYRGSLEQLPDFYDELFSRERVDAVLLFGPSRPIHAAAIDAARARDIPAWAFDEGYFRPDWITLDLNGAGAGSALPRTAQRVRLLAHRLQLPPASMPIAPGWFERSVRDVQYRIAGAADAWRYPGYRNHRPFAAWREYLGFIRRIARDGLRRNAYRRAFAEADTAANSGAPVFFVPLQLDHDFALRRHSDHPDMNAALERIFDSFAGHAPPNAILLVKRHPLDAEFVDRRRWIARAAARRGIGDRVKYFAGGDVRRALDISRGIVTVNSTVGLQAIDRGLPVSLLGRACYAVPGLVSAQTLEQFWHAPAPPDPALYRAFRAAAIALTQLNGNFYSRSGRRRAVLQALDRIEAQSAYISLLTEAEPAIQVAHVETGQLRPAPSVHRPAGAVPRTHTKATG